MGGLRLAMDMIHKYIPDAVIYTSNPTYPPHRSMAKIVGI